MAGSFTSIFNCVTVKDLYISRKFAPRMAPTLQELVGEGVTEVSPALQSLFLEGLCSSEPVHEEIGKLVVVRQSASRPITISHWDGEQVDLWELGE